jgi:hypothetical protein
MTTVSSSKSYLRFQTVLPNQDATTLRLPEKDQHCGRIFFVESWLFSRPQRIDPPPTLSVPLRLHGAARPRRFIAKVGNPYLSTLAITATPHYFFILQPVKGAIANYFRNIMHD